MTPEKHLDHRPMWREKGAFLVHDMQLAFPKKKRGYVNKIRETAVGSNFRGKGSQAHFDLFPPPYSSVLRFGPFIISLIFCIFSGLQMS